jgi:hypothetical protein
MRHLQFALLVVMLVCTTVAAQDSHHFEVFGGYSLERIAPCGGLSSAEYPCNAETGFLAPTTTFNGWDAAFTSYFARFLAVTADFTGTGASMTRLPARQSRDTATCPGRSSRGGCARSRHSLAFCSAALPRMFQAASGITTSSRGPLVAEWM